MQGHSSYLSNYIKRLFCIKKNQNKELINNEEISHNKDRNTLNDSLTNKRLNENQTQGNVERLETTSDFINLERKILQNVKKLFLK